MKKTEIIKTRNLDEFDTVSLYQLIPSGTGKAIKNLKLILDSILNNPEQEPRKPLSILITGKQGLKTHANSFLRAIGIESTNESPAQLFQASQVAMHEFFNPIVAVESHLISNIEKLSFANHRILYEILSKGKYSITSFSIGKELVGIYNPVIMTSHDISKVPKYIISKIDHIVSLEDYTTQQLELIVLQRIKYCQIDYEEGVLKLLVESGAEMLDCIVRLLKNSITVMLADCRNILTVEDVKKVMGLG